MRLYVVRHAQTAWNVAGIAQGHTDIPLDEVGQEQARCLGEAFKEIPLDRIWCSDLARARQTALSLHQTTGAPIEERMDLRERCFGEWEGLSYAEFTSYSQRVAQESGQTIFEVAPPGGESFADVWRRIQPFAVELESGIGNAAIVSHGGTCGLLLARLFQGNLATSRAFRLKNTSITELELRQDGFYSLVRYGDISHLDEMRPAMPTR